MSKIYDWQKHFDPAEKEFLKHGAGSSRNKIKVVCHRDPKEEKRLSREFCQTFKKAKFTFAKVDVDLRHGNFTDEGVNEVRLHRGSRPCPCFTNIIFSICEDTKSCEQCRRAVDLKKYLQKKSFIGKHESHQYSIKNILLRDFKIYNWIPGFDRLEKDWLQFGEKSSRNKVMVICHRNPKEEKQRFLKNTKNMYWSATDKSKFSFHRIKSAEEVLECYDEILKNYFSNIIFSICRQDFVDKCSKCKPAVQLREYLQDKSLIRKDGRYQYDWKNFYIRNISFQGLKKAKKKRFSRPKCDCCYDWLK